MAHFVHAADIHLDRSLPALTMRGPQHLLSDAPRRAFTKLIDYTIDSGAEFLVLAGDIYDGAWKDASTGIYFHEQVGRLRAHQIGVYLLHGNHDAVSAMTKTLVPPDNVHRFGHKAPESFHYEPLNIWLHGQSFAKVDVSDNLASQYPAPVPGAINIGVLHTALTGYPPHGNYAPCSLEQLTGYGYDYWALGHVHQHKVLNQSPAVVYPGNLQALHINERGARGAVRVPIEDGTLGKPEFIPFDVLRFDHVELDLPPEVVSLEGLVALLRNLLQHATDRADERHLVLRYSLRCHPKHHRLLTSNPRAIEDELLGLAASFPGAVTLEDVRVHMQPSQGSQAGEDGVDALAELERYFTQAKTDPDFLAELVVALQPALSKRPSHRTDETTLLDAVSGGELDRPLDEAIAQLRARLGAVD